MRTAFGLRFDVPDGYLNTASIGVPSTGTVEAVTAAVATWGAGGARPTDFDADTDAGRELFGRLVGVPADRVAVGATVSQLVGIIAADLPDGARVLVAENEFTSVTFPFAAQADRGVQVEEVPLEAIPEKAADHDLVAVSVVQSADGRLVDLEALREAVRDRPTRVLLDTTQAAGWLPMRLDWADHVVGTGYKWLLAPRGSSWLAQHPDAPAPRASHANWYAGGGMDSIYGLPLKQAPGGRGLDLSPVWLAQVGAAASMRELAALDLEQVRAHCTGLADRVRAELGLVPAGSPIVAVPGDDAARRLADAGIACAARAGKARLAFHLYNTDTDVDLVLRALRG
ncbi:aminotransferase class V-fold PLP-dependent enzyme [Saccharopolyspora sp. 7B]|uniref:aminotransferase class V-fold PLP-dependent enzyme n=1 Tax=Saccharopolyspora sp. 7B TaxID=2877240 RepID=UPI001CD6CC12|nr:aminotransferase class V-fold PLP-dependent enzyme [Saccharopolyspora sp. 7B]MCA1282077.1 aminotransferase class V-fold PLP-dependent enzyme [Saccharopolyspora sp. 7B]